MKTYYDLLETAGHWISEIEQNLTIKNGLDEEYEQVIVVISSKETFPNMHHSTLLAHEERVEQRKSISTNYSINYASNSRVHNQESESNNKNN